MIVSYKKLWKLLIDRDLMKKDLREQAGLTTNVIAKMGKNEMSSQKCYVRSVMHWVARWMILLILFRILRLNRIKPRTMDEENRYEKETFH